MVKPFELQHKVICSVLGLVLIALSAQPTASGQNKTPVKLSVQTGSGGELASEKLAKPVNLPYFSLSGTEEFATGTLFRNATGGPSVTMQFRSKYGQTEILDYYKQTLKSNRWQFDSAGQNSACACAQRSGNYLQITVQPATKRGFKCDILVHYRFSRTSS